MASLFLELVLLLLCHVSNIVADHPAAQHVGVWETPPYRCPTSLVSDCPLLGNGDMGIGLGGIAASPDQATLNQSYYLGKMVSRTKFAPTVLLLYTSALYLYMLR